MTSRSPHVLGTRFSRGIAELRGELVADRWDNRQIALDMLADALTAAQGGDQARTLSHVLDAMWFLVDQDPELEQMIRRIHGVAGVGTE